MFQPCLTFYTWWSTPSAFIDATLTFPCNYPAQRKRSFYNPSLVHVGSTAGKFPIFIEVFNFCLWDIYFFYILVAVTVEYKVQLAIHKYLNWFSFEKAGFWHQELNHGLVYCLCCSGVSFVARIITWLSVSVVIQKWIVEKLLEKPDVSVKRVRYPALWDCNSGLAYYANPVPGSLAYKKIYTRRLLVHLISILLQLYFITIFQLFSLIPFWINLPWLASLSRNIPYLITRWLL